VLIGWEMYGEEERQPSEVRGMVKAEDEGQPNGGRYSLTWLGFKIIRTHDVQRWQ
jgi:hypothetical protein